MIGPLYYQSSLTRLRLISTRIGYVLGMVLIIAAVVAVWQKHDEVVAAVEALRSPDPVMIAVLLSAIVINVILTGLFFSVLLSRYGNVRWTEMIAVFALATLLNYLPMRPGLLARLAYHKTVNEIRLRDSVVVQVQAMIISLLTAGGVVVLIVMGNALSLGIVWPMVVLIAALAVTAFCVPPVRVLAVATMIRLLELVTWTARYYAAFSLLGLSIDISSATALACVSMVVSMIPIFSNGLGVREWTIGALSPQLTTNLVSQGLTAELVNRAAEVVVIAVCGIAALVWLAHDRRGRKRVETPIDRV